jgi:hypothetical protein
LGPVRHIEVGQLWIQDKVNSGDIGIEKIGGKTNLADTLTKHSDSGSLETHISGTCLQFRTGRHHEAPDVAGDEMIENIDWGANEEANERCGTDQEGNREGVMGRLSMCEHIDRLRDATQQQGVDFEGRNCHKGASGSGNHMARDFRDFASVARELRERRRGMQANFGTTGFRGSDTRDAAKHSTRQTAGIHKPE